jgi:outer membrane protein
MKYRVTIPTMLAALLAAPLLSLGQSAPASPGKVGVINIQEAIASTAEGKKAFADLQKKYAPRQQELQRLQQEIQSIQDQLSKQQATLSDEEQRRLSRELEDKQKILKRSTEDANADFSSDRDDAIRRIGQKMVRVISDYAQQNGYSLIVDDAQIPVYYASKDIDLTQEIVKRYDTVNPMAAEAGTGATPAGNAAAKPAAQASKPADAPKK